MNLLRLLPALSLLALLLIIVRMKIIGKLKGAKFLIALSVIILAIACFTAAVILDSLGK